MIDMSGGGDNEWNGSFGFVHASFNEGWTSFSSICWMQAEMVAS